ncbi:TetR/AcrR family transcriptional regulator [Arenibacterium sp. CAU 1754]
MIKEKRLSRREKNLADIRERAIPVAESIIFEEGIEALSARRLAGEIDVSVGSLYNAFGDLDGVVRAVIAESAAMLSEVLHSAVELPADGKRSRIVALGEAYFDFAVAEPQRWWLLFEYKSNFPLEKKVQDFQLGLLEMLIRAGDANPKSEQHRQFFLQLWASVHGLVSLACRPSIVAIDPAQARSYISDLVNAGFSAFSAD